MSLTKEQITRKWSPLLEKFGIPKEYCEKVSQYINHHTMLDRTNAVLPTLPPTARLADTAPSSNNPFPSLLPMAISVLKNIKDLSKVRFVADTQWEEHGTFKQIDVKRFEARIDHTKAFDLMHKYGLDVVQEAEELGVKLISDDINKAIDEGKLISIYLVVSTVKVMGDMMLRYTASSYGTLFFTSMYLVEDMPVTINDL